MNQTDMQHNSGSQQDQLRLWTAGIFTVLGAIFFLYAVYFIAVVQQGRFDLSDFVLLPTTVLMCLISGLSYILIRRGRTTQGVSILYFLVTLVPPVVATLVFQGFGLISSIFIVLLASIMIIWILPDQTRQSAITAGIIAIVLIIGIELWNPSFRTSTETRAFTIIITLLTGLALFIVLAQRAWKVAKVRGKLIGSVSILSMSLIGVLTGNSIWNSFQFARAEELRQLTAVYENYNNYVSTLENSAVSLALSLADREDIIRLHRTGDRQGLLELLTPIYNSLNSDYNIAHIYIEEPDGTVFVRVDNPATYGDDITYRGTTTAALLSKDPVAGVDIETDNIGVRGVAPIFESAQFVGYENRQFEGLVEVGIDYDQAFLDSLKTNTGVDYTMWVSHAAAAPAGLQPPFLTVSPPVPELFYYNSTYPSILSIPAEAYSRVLQSGSPETHYVTGNQQEMVVYLAPLSGYGNRTIGVLEIISPRTETLAIIQNDLVNSLGIAALVSLIGFTALILLSQIVILKPIEVLSNISRRQLEGDLAARVPPLANDEFGELGITLNALTESLQGSVHEMEERVSDRTAELERASQQIEQRAEQFEAIAQVSRIISSIQDLEELLPRITRMISQYFGFYHTGIFLLDDNHEFAVLRAANSEGGQKMLERGHRLEIGETGIVGYVTATGSPRIALDTGADAVYFDNPDLPETRSEMALPLKSGAEVIGALDVQSIVPNAFTEDDVNILSALADQVSTAILNARLYQEARESLSRAEAASRQLMGKAWNEIQNYTPVIGYKFDGTKPEPIKEPVNDETSDEGNGSFYAPVQLRGEIIGSLRINPPTDGHKWTDDEIAIIQATAERVALAAENARLVMESQKRASKEQVIGEITTKIGAAINLDNLLQTTLREMGRILPGAEISIQVENE